MTQKVGGNKVKQELTVRVGIEQEQSKKIVKLIKDSKLKVQASIQGETVRVSRPSVTSCKTVLPWFARKLRTILCSMATSGD